MASKPTQSTTRQRIRADLKSDGPSDAEALAARLGVTGMAVRQHLYAMAEEKLVIYEEVARPKGRPAKVWRLTEAADAFFPDGHADLAMGLIDSLKSVFGDAGMDQLLAARADEQVTAYKARTDRHADLAKRCAELAKIRAEEGYMAAVEEGADGALMLIENHCPVCSAARTCAGLCAMELDVFQRVLGDKVSIERTDHIMAGARRCSYRISET